MVYGVFRQPDWADDFARVSWAVAGVRVRIEILITSGAALLCAVSLAGQEQVSLTVDATMDIYRAGGYNDGSDGIAPVVFSFPARALSKITFPAVGGAWTCQTGEPEFSADGETSGYCVTSGGFSNIYSVGPFAGYYLTDFVDGMAGIFLEDSLPTSAAPGLRFYVSNSADGGTQTDFLTLSPKIGQVFFIGDGLTGTGTGQVQTFNVPPTATHLYLGFVDNCRAPSEHVPGCYSDNVGSMNVTARLQHYVPDWVEPALTTAPSARCCSSMVYDASASYTLLFGGGDSLTGATHNDTWIWRNGWTQVTPASAPSSRSSAGAAYDTSMGTVVLFGGSDSSGHSLGDTWIWDGVTWSQQFPPVSPPARDCSTAGMAYDPVSGPVLFGGYSASTSGYGGVPLGDTWVWDGFTKTWEESFPASSPSPRRAPLAFDPISGNVVLFGGDNGGGDCCNIYYNDTWTWDGITWTQQFPAVSPPARTEHMMAYDAGLGEIVMYGGYNIPGQGLDDTWAWNGKSWRQLTLPGSPSGRWGSSMDFDPLSDGLVLFGGEVTGDPYTNNTWLLIPVPVP